MMMMNHATIKTWKFTKNDLEKPGVGLFWESGDPVNLEDRGIRVFYMALWNSTRVRILEN